MLMLERKHLCLAQPGHSLFLVFLKSCDPYGSLQAWAAAAEERKADCLPSDLLKPLFPEARALHLLISGLLEFLL